jgi:hypothetical protein
VRLRIVVPHPYSRGSDFPRALGENSNCGGTDK